MEGNISIYKEKYEMFTGDEGKKKQWEWETDVQHMHKCACKCANLCM